MMTRTRPAALPSGAAPDVVRALERLECQMRRAADDLAATLEAIRAAGLLAAVPGRCGRVMRSPGDRCARFTGHNGGCRSRAALDADMRRNRTSRTGAAA